MSALLKPLRSTLRRTPGFTISETMSGEHSPVDGSESHPIEFDATWGAPSLARLIDPSHPEFFTFDMHGSITADGLCEGAELNGYLSVEYFSKARIRYAFSFQADRTLHRFEGSKSDMRPWNLHRTHTTLHGRIVREVDTMVSEATLTFPLWRLPIMALSFRLNFETHEEPYL